MTPKEKILARRIAKGGRFTVRYEKRSGEFRQVRFSVNPSEPVRFSRVDRAAMVRVWDLDKNEHRMIRFGGVTQLTEVRLQEPEDPAALTAEKLYRAEWRMMQELF